jgi:hypothetical protein
MIKFFISGIIVLMGFYYLTVFLHLMGVQIFHVKEISVGKALIPFYYWFKREVVK